MSQLSFYFPSAMPASCDFSGMQQVHIFLAFMTSIVYLSSGVPSLNALHRNGAKWEELTHSSMLVWRTVRLLANDSKTLNETSKTKEKTSLSLAEANPKTLRALAYEERP